MNKSDLIDVLSEKENLAESNASEIVNMVFDGFTDALKNNGRIEIRGFGGFSVREYGADAGRNPWESLEAVCSVEAACDIEVKK